MSYAHLRKYLRISLSGLVLLKIINTDVQTSGPVEVISRGEMGVYTRHELKKGSRVSVKLFCDIAQSDLDFTFTGTIRTGERREEFACLGIEFEKEINSIDHPHLYHYLISQEKSINQKNSRYTDLSRVNRT